MVPDDQEPGRGFAGIRAAWRAILLALVFRYAAYLVMTALAVWNERRPAPSLPARFRATCRIGGRRPS